MNQSSYAATLKAVKIVLVVLPPGESYHATSI